MERADWLRKTAGIEVRYANRESDAPYPMDILRNGKPVGRIVRSGSWIVIELAGIGEVDKDKAISMDALEVWDFHQRQDDLVGEEVDKRIGERIYCFLGEWVQQNSRQD